MLRIHCSWTPASTASRAWWADRFGLDRHLEAEVRAE